MHRSRDNVQTDDGTDPRDCRFDRTHIRHHHQGYPILHVLHPSQEAPTNPTLDEEMGFTVRLRLISRSDEWILFKRPIQSVFPFPEYRQSMGKEGQERKSLNVKRLGWEGK